MGRILIADDDELIVDLVRAAFASTPHFVAALADGNSALRLIQQRPPHLVILDCNMPGMSGINVLRELRRSCSSYELPVLMLTGRQTDEDERISRYEGANDYMRKPFSPELLVRRVEALLKGERPLLA